MYLSLPSANYVSGVKIVNVAFLTLHIPSSNTHARAHTHTQLRGCYGKMISLKRVFASIWYNQIYYILNKLCAFEQISFNSGRDDCFFN